MSDRFTIEGDTLYFGRDDQRHGYNLGQLTDRSFNALDILNQHVDEIERLREVAQIEWDEWTENLKEIERLRAALARSCEEGRDEMYDCGYNRLRNALERILGLPAQMFVSDIPKEIAREALKDEQES